MKANCKQNSGLTLSENFWGSIEYVYLISPGGCEGNQLPKLHGPGSVESTYHSVTPIPLFSLAVNIPSCLNHDKTW